MRTFNYIFATLLLLAAGNSALPAYAQSAEDLLSRGYEAYLDYDFDEASRLYAQAKKKAKRGDEEFALRHAQLQQKLNLANEFIERVEQIEVFDSITVPRDKFFKSYRLPHSAGVLGTGADIPFHSTGADYVFTSENGDYKIWAMPDSTGFSRLTESIRLTDGQWHDPVVLDVDSENAGDQIFPFMMADGVTLYYADNGENSLGGYDIMIATRDAQDGEFLQPQNLGMPYNSPYDDYLLAIDELNGVGWWATDRNQLEDMVTIYMFKVNDVRRNYPADHEDIADLARISDIAVTQDPDTDYSELISTIRAIDPEAEVRKVDFRFPMPGSKVYTRYEDFRSQSARTMMRKYVAAQKSADADLAKLSDLRRRYHESPAKRLGDEIKALEQKCEHTRAELTRLRSDVYRAESSH